MIIYIALGAQNVIEASGQYKQIYFIRHLDDIMDKHTEIGSWLKPEMLLIVHMLPKDRPG